jgi:hypothetical protein
MANTSSRSGISRKKPRKSIENELALMEDVRSRACVLLNLAAERTATTSTIGCLLNNRPHVTLHG